MRVYAKDGSDKGKRVIPTETEPSYVTRRSKDSFSMRRIEMDEIVPFALPLIFVGVVASFVLGILIQKGGSGQEDWLLARMVPGIIAFGTTLVFFAVLMAGKPTWKRVFSTVLSTWKEMLLVALSAWMFYAQTVSTPGSLFFAFGFIVLTVRYSYLWEERRLWEPFVFVVSFLIVVVSYRLGVLEVVPARILLAVLTLSSYVSAVVIVMQGFRGREGTSE